MLIKQSNLFKIKFRIMSLLQEQVPNYEIVFLNKKINKYCLIIPVINEGKNIKILLDRISKINLNKIIDILIVDGGSSDGSLDFNNLKKTIRSLLIMKTDGKLSSQLRCAYSFALKEQYDGFVTIDGNNKDDPNLVIDFINYLDKGFHFVQASRFITNGRAINTPILRYLSIRLIHAPMLSFFSGFNWTDTTQGYRGYSRKIFEDKSIAPFREIFISYELLSYLSYRVPKLGYNCIEIPSTRIYPKFENNSKIRGLANHLSILKILFFSCIGFYDPK